MKPKRHQPAGQIRATIEATFDQIRLARAAELAHSRRLLEAAALLTPDGHLPESTQGLDMLARIAVRLQDFQTARRCWEYASQMEPENPAYAEFLGELELAKKKAVVRQKVMIGLSAAVMGAALAALGFILWQEMAGGRESSLARKPVPPSTLPIQSAPPKNTPAATPSKKQ